MDNKSERTYMGRPKTADYRKKMHRFSRLEDKMMAAIKNFESEKDVQLVLGVLEDIKNGVKKK